MFSSKGRKGRRAVWMMAGVLGLVGSAFGGVTLSATQNADASSFFTLDFGAYGGARTAQISTTSYELALDADAQTARFLGYAQTVASLTLPGNYPTGEITVSIASSTPGAYDPATGHFTTNDIYRIEFTSIPDLGLESPLLLPGSASGVITYNSLLGGTIDSAWTGEGQIGDPLNPLVFAYTCNTSVTFSVTPEPTALGLLLAAGVMATRRRG